MDESKRVKLPCILCLCMCFNFKFGTSWHVSKQILHEYYVTAGYPNVIISAFLQSVKQYGELAIPKGENDTSIVGGINSSVAVQFRSPLFRDVALNRLVGYQCFGTTYRSHLQGSFEMRTNTVTLAPLSFTSWNDAWQQASENYATFNVLKFVYYKKYGDWKIVFFNAGSMVAINRPLETGIWNSISQYTINASTN